MGKEDGRVVSNFLVQALSDRRISIYGDGSQTRSFCYVDDLVEGLFRLMTTEQPIIEPVNLGNPDEITVLELASHIEKLMGKALKVDHHPLPQDDPLLRRPDIGTAARLLDWRPAIPPDDGLKRTALDFVQELDVADLFQTHLIWTTVPDLHEADQQAAVSAS